MPGDPLTEILPLAFNESMKCDVFPAVAPQTDMTDATYKQLIEDVIAGRKKLPDGYYFVHLVNDPVPVDKRTIDDLMHYQKRMYEKLKQIKRGSEP